MRRLLALLPLLCALGSQEPEPPRTNHLAGETSPYLLQHATNPVEWYPWGPEALERARREEKPILLSIGYSACHWCHVMEEESFEDDAIAAFLAAHFIAIKVDREERPDIDATYMDAAQAMTGRGGWPLNVFLTPELEPFFGGTYFPPEDRGQLPSFRRVLEALAELWENDRPRLVEAGRELARRIAEHEGRDTSGAFDASALDAAWAALERSFDARWGGFGRAPKFPHPTDIALCLGRSVRLGDARALSVARTTLERMAAGGLQDQLAGGFHRYSVDERWQVPHFEKMLYDNAQLAEVYLDAFRVTGDPELALVARRTLDWMLAELRLAEGAFASSLDADSEGEEGVFYTWTRAELERVLGAEDAALAAAWWGLDDGAGLEGGRRVLWRPRPAAEIANELGLDPAEHEELEARVERLRAALLTERAKRMRPARDDKVLTSWNALAISALARGRQLLGDERYGAAAREALEFLVARMRAEDGSLRATWRAGEARLAGNLDDHVFVIRALIDLWETDFDPRWLALALELEALVAARFEDAERGGFFTTSAEVALPLGRRKDPEDDALPAGNGVHAVNLLRLWGLSGRTPLRERAERTLAAFGGAVERAPAAYASLLAARQWLAAGPREIALAGARGSAPLEALLQSAWRHPRPWRVLALVHEGVDPELVPLVAERSAPKGEARAWVCTDFTCKAPVATPEELRATLGAP